MAISSYSLAVNTYFNKNRGKAVGYATTITAIGPIVMPQLITFLMSNYTSQSAMFIIGGLCTHAFVSALLLQPVKWHMKEAVDETENHEEQNQLNEKLKKQTISVMETGKIII